jgi:hypothetical protein
MNATDDTRRSIPSDPAPEVTPSEGMRRATGRDRGEWFGVLDTWGAAGRPYREIADWLVGAQGLSNWWAQKLIVEYEEARGLRAPGVRRDGSFEIGASKTIGAPTQRVREAFLTKALRDRWLPDAILIERTATAWGDPLRFDWGDGGSRIVVDIGPSGEGRSQVSLQHLRLPDAGTAAETKAFWRERLTVLKTLLEG